MWIHTLEQTDKNSVLQVVSFDFIYIKRSHFADEKIFEKHCFKIKTFVLRGANAFRSYFPKRSSEKRRKNSLIPQIGYDSVDSSDLRTVLFGGPGLCTRTTDAGIASDVFVIQTIHLVGELCICSWTTIEGASELLPKFT